MKRKIFNFKNLLADSVAVYGDSDIITYRQLYDEITSCGPILGERSLIFCFTENSVGSLLGYVAALTLGHVPLLLSARLDDGLAQNLITTYKPDWLWVPKRFATVSPTWRIVHHVRDQVLIKTSYNRVYPIHPELALLLPTSGTTGSPKMVRHTYENLRSNIASIVEYLQISSDRIAITTLPMNYTYGFSVINTHLWSGASIVMTNYGVLQKPFWNLVKKYGVTSLSGVPYTWEMLTRLGIINMDIPSVRHCDQAGGKLSPTLQERLIRWAYETARTFTVMYGQTEASPRMGYLPWQMAAKKYGCMGVAVPNGRFMLIDDKGNEILEADCAGELLYMGPNVTPGYAVCGEDLSAGDERGGLLHTGDIAKRDKDGFYTILGRKARFLKVFGNRVNLDDLERMLSFAFSPVSFACSGTDDELSIYVVQGQEDKIYQEFLAKKTGLHPSSFHIRHIDALPRNESGKIIYEKLNHILY